ncbi:peptidoglycan-binding domain-containing protein [Amedibacillus sp. YH-ame10]
MNTMLAPLQIGSVGIGVNKMQGYLNIFQEKGIITTKLKLDGDYGPKTANAVREYQAHARLPITGQIDNTTWSAIVNELRDLGVVTNIPVSSRSFYLTKGNQGLEVYKMQEYLNETAAKNSCLRPVPMDAMYGDRTAAGVSQFQYLYDLIIDGNIGKATWDAIVNTRNGF